MGGNLERNELSFHSIQEIYKSHQPYNLISLTKMTGQTMRSMRSLCCCLCSLLLRQSISVEGYHTITHLEIVP